MKKENEDTYTYGGSTCPAAADDQGRSSLAVWRQAGGSHCYTDIEEVFHRLVEKGIPEVVNDQAAFREQLHRHCERLQALRGEYVPRRCPGDVVPLELNNNNKHFGRLKAEEAYAYVNRFVDMSGDEDFSCIVSEEEPERRDAARPTVEKEVKHQASVVQVEAGIDEDMKAQHEVRNSHMLSKIAEVKESWRWRGRQSLKLLIYRVIYSNANTTGHLECQKKSWPNYTLNTLLFACTMLFSAYMNPSSASITIKILLVVDIVVCITINAVLLIKLPNWGNALGCISWFLLEFAMCLLILPFNGRYAFCILTVLFLIVIVALVQPKLQHAVNKYALPSFFTTDDSNTHNDIGDQENEYLNHLFDISNGIATCGGLVTGILGYYSYMEGPVTAAGFFFFCTVLLGLYLMMVIAMRAVSAPHAAYLTIVLKALLLLTVITASVSFVRHSVTTM